MALVIIGVIVAIFVFASTASGQTFFGGLMGNLTPQQISQVAQNAGFRDEDLVTAVAVALAESSGNPGAVGDQSITPGGSVGLWQINLKWHPEYTAESLKDPQVNANAAFAIYSAAGDSFTPWSTFKTGAYLAHMSAAQEGMADV